jgi:uncharacterized membrane protein
MESLGLLFESPLDLWGFVFYVLVFPVYHAIYPALMRLIPRNTAGARFDALRRSWIEGLIERRDLNAAAQQTRNLTMVNSILVSSSLILMGVSANLILRLPALPETMPHPAAWDAHPEVLRAKLYLLILVFAVAFSYFMTALRHLGHFNLVIGADPAVVREQEGDPVTYFSALINRASHRYTLGVRCLYSAFPLFGWLFDPWLFLIMTTFWAVKFMVFQDFRHLTRRGK